MEKKIKALFLLGGLPHYFRLLLERMDETEDIGVMLAIPISSGTLMGAAVQENREEAGFRRFELPEHRAWYGKSSLGGLEELLLRERPDIVIAGWPYVLQFYFNPGLPRLLRKNNIRFRSEEHTSELQSLMRISYAVFCLKKKNIKYLFT